VISQLKEPLISVAFFSHFSISFCFSSSMHWTLNPRRSTSLCRTLWVFLASSMSRVCFTNSSPRSILRRSLSFLRSLTSPISSVQRLLCSSVSRLNYLIKSRSLLSSAFAYKAWFSRVSSWISFLYFSLASLISLSDSAFRFSIYALYTSAYLLAS
jgi:hypothetical protein